MKAGRASGHGAPPPWRPAFKLEDFEDDTTVATLSRCAKKGNGGPRRTKLLWVHDGSTARARAFDGHRHVNVTEKNHVHPFLVLINFTVPVC
jgi:hypothetical protein